MKRLMRNEKGLTLIELLAVIVILGIIAAIAVPSIGGIIDKTKDDAKKAEAIMIFEAARLYMATTEYKEDTSNTKMSIPSTELLPYLDKLDDKEFTVEVTLDSTSKKYIYTLVDHEYKTPITEDELLGTEKDETK